MKDILKKLQAMFNSWFNKPQPVKPVVNPEVEHGFTHKAIIVASMEMTKLTASHVYFKAERRRWNVTAQNCDGEIHCYIKRGDKWVGGKFDHIRPTSSSRDFLNLNPAAPYGVFKTLGVPVKGERVAFLAVNYTGTERTNAIFGIWQ